MKKLLYIVFSILALVSLTITGCSSSSNEKQTTEISQAEILYPDDSAINDFLIHFNSTCPEYAISSDSISKYSHHGSDHDNQISTSINGVRVIISSEGYQGKNGISVYFDIPSNGDVYTNHKMFGILMRGYDPTLSSEEIESLWNEMISNDTVSKLSNGIAVSHETLITGKDEPGSYGYLKLSGKPKE